jgi:alanine-synthesizing transaminase
VLGTRCGRSSRFSDVACAGLVKPAQQRRIPDLGPVCALLADIGADVPYYVLYSHRLSWSFSPNRYSSRIAELKTSGAHLLDLSSSNPTSAGFAYPDREISRALSAVQNFSYEPDPAGELVARKAVADYYKARGYDISLNRILLTASTSEAYSHLFKLLCDPGDEVLIPLPSYPLFEFLAALESVRTVPYWLRYDGNWHIDFEWLTGHITALTKAIIVVNPNNPTGSFLTQHDAEKLLDIAAERGFAVIADEVFFDYEIGAANDRVKTLVNRTGPLTFSLNGFSKAAAMPQMKLGWMVLSGPEYERQQARERLELVLDTYLSVNTPVQRAAPVLLAAGEQMQRQILQRVQRNYQALKQKLLGSAAHPLEAGGGWSAIVQLPRTRSEEEWLFALLEEKGVIVQPGYYFDMGCEAYMVVSLITSPEIFKEGVGRLNDLVGTG